MRRALDAAAVLGGLAIALLGGSCATPIEIPGNADKSSPPYHSRDSGTIGYGDGGPSASDQAPEPMVDSWGPTDRGDGGLSDAGIDVDDALASDALVGDALVGDGASDAGESDDASSADAEPADGGGADDATPGGDDV